LRQHVARKRAERGIKTDRALHPREVLERAQHLERRVSAVWLPMRVDCLGRGSRVPKVGGGRMC
jgi:hypothetical protein